MLVFIQNTCYSCYVFRKLELSRHIFEKYFLNFMSIRLVAGDVFHWDELIDRYDEPNYRFSPFCERAQKENQISENLQFYLQVFIPALDIRVTYLC
jgi:thioredoxin-related protein